jgi:hypothetical protein
MLDLSVATRPLTQGRPPGRMTLARRPSAEAGPAAPSPEIPPAPASAPAPSSVEPAAVARRVFQLMQRELTIRRDRRGGGG